MSVLTCTVRGVRQQFKLRTAQFEMEAKRPVWTVTGAMGPHALSPRARDLLDIAGAIYRVKSQIRRRATDPAVAWEIEAPVRDAEFWRTRGGAPLAATLGFLNRARWTFTFVDRLDAVEFKAPATDEREVDQVTLFSGGMDSLCGAGADTHARDRIALVSYYHSQSALQARLAGELGYSPPTQWRLTGHRGREGMNLIRSFMFLTLGAVTAHSYGARGILQYENGVLATAVPQSGNFIPTRHAHPETHRRMTELLRAVFGTGFSIENPFLEMTKRQVGKKLVDAIGRAKSDDLHRQTETCWYLFQPKVRGHKKENGQPCGVCTPCIVRLTARPGELAPDKAAGWKGYAFDLRKPQYADDPLVGTSFRAYLELVDIALSAADDARMIEELAPEARALIDDDKGPSTALVAGLLRRFAEEFCDTFGIKTTGNGGRSGR